MGAATIDLNNTDELVFEGRRVLAERFGVEGARKFLDSYVRDHSFAYPRISAEKLAEIKANARDFAEEMRGKGEGDYTKEKYENKEDISFEEYAAELMQIQDMMHVVKRERPEMSIGQCGTEAAMRCALAREKKRK